MDGEATKADKLSATHAIKAAAVSATSEELVPLIPADFESGLASHKNYVRFLEGFVTRSING